MQILHQVESLFDWASYYAQLAHSLENMMFMLDEMPLQNASKICHIS